MADHIYIVDTALSKVPINDKAIVDASTLARKTDLAYNASGLVLYWNFITPDGAYTQTAVTPTDTGGDYDWIIGEIITIEIPDSGGASINNDTEGTGWFTGFATGFLPWRSPIYLFLPEAAANAFGLGTNFITTADLDTKEDIRAEMDSNSTQLADIVSAADSIPDDVVTAINTAEPNVTATGVTLSSAAITDLAAAIAGAGLGTIITSKLLAFGK